MLRKVNALIKYEIINLKRGILIWIILVLYIFGIQQSISSMLYANAGFVSVFGFIKGSWLSLNFIMIPLMLIGIKVGKSNNDIIKVMDIGPMEIILSKLGTMAIISGVILLINIALLAILAIICRVSFTYFIYQGIGYILNTVVFLMLSSLLSLTIGQVIAKYFGSVIAVIITVMLFIILSNFYKISNSVIPLIDIRQFPNSFDVISYDKGYVYHNVFWLIISFLCIQILYLDEYIKLKKIKAIMLNLGSIILGVVIVIWIGRVINLTLPDYYNICSRADASASISKNVTFFSKDNCGYYIYKYDMNLNIDKNFQNDCKMKIEINKKNINYLEFGLYKKLNVSKVILEGSKVDFRRTNNSVIVKLPAKYKNFKLINMQVVYKGEINTSWIQGNELFYVRDNGMLLADVFEWYPKLNDSKTKEYSINVRYKGNKKIYSNLNEGNGNVFKGKEREIFLMYGNIKERKYKGRQFIGNEEYIYNDKQCDNLLDQMREQKYEEVSKLVFAPLMPGITKMDKPYEKAFFWAIY